MTNIHNSSKPFVEKRLKSFKYAFRGLWALLMSETNARIHLIITSLVIVIGYMFEINAMEWCLVLFCIALVFVSEAINTSIEKLSDHISPGYHRHIKKVKDLSASAVLISSIVSIIVGLIIFLPKFLVFIEGLK